MGMVLLEFSVERMVRQMAAVSGVGAEQVKEVLFDRGLMPQYEAGKISTSEFYEVYCGRIGVRPDFDALCHAGSEIFTLNVPMLPIVAQLGAAGYRLGVLSNTCDCHWQYCSEHYRFLNECFDVHALSFKIKAAKPDRAIFLAAAELARCRAEEIFFVDDVAGHVEGAKAAGIDAVVYASAAQVAAELRARGVRFNY
jgi:glucose-1-phosphatase